MSEEKKQNENRRFLGKVKNIQGKNGTFQRIMIDNPSPVNQDGSANTYNKGVLIWCDNVTGKKYLVKQFSVSGVSQKARESGFSNSICIDLDDTYDVQELK